MWLRDSGLWFSCLWMFSTGGTFSSAIYPFFNYCRLSVWVVVAFCHWALTFSPWTGSRVTRETDYSWITRQYRRTDCGMTDGLSAQRIMRFLLRRPHNKKWSLLCKLIHCLIGWQIISLLAAAMFLSVSDVLKWPQRRRNDVLTLFSCRSCVPRKCEYIPRPRCLLAHSCQLVDYLTSLSWKN